jgi:polyhydroxyalkanoate synthesis regulator phasin
MQNNLANLAQRALYLGMGLASYAADKAMAVVNQAPTHLSELRKRTQKITDELVRRGEMTAEEARAYVEAVAKAQNRSPKETGASEEGPRTIQIDDMGDVDEANDTKETTAIQLTDSARLRKEIEQLQAELERLKNS